MDFSSPSGGTGSGVTDLIADLRAGRKEASGKVFEHIYAKLRQLARGQRKR